jgi:hypothetical protein
MKKVLLVLVLFGLLSAVSPVNAADVDGAWLVSSPFDPTAAVAMLKEDGGLLLATYCDYSNALMRAWLPLLGPFDGTNGQLSLVLTSQANGHLPESLTVAFTLTSETTATVTITSCVDFPQQSNCPPTGLVFNLVKIF